MVTSLLFVFYLTPSRGLKLFTKNKKFENANYLTPSGGLKPVVASNYAFQVCLPNPLWGIETPDDEDVEDSVDYLTPSVKATRWNNGFSSCAFTFHPADEATQLTMNKNKLLFRQMNKGLFDNKDDFYATARNV